MNQISSKKEVNLIATKKSSSKKLKSEKQCKRRNQLKNSHYNGVPNGSGGANTDENKTQFSGTDASPSPMKLPNPLPQHGSTFLQETLALNTIPEQTYNERTRGQQYNYYEISTLRQELFAELKSDLTLLIEQKFRELEQQYQ